MATVLRSLRFQLFFGLALSVFLPAFGAPKPTAPSTPLPAVWTLPAALDRAMQANPELVSARLEVEREEGARWQVRARMLPRVSAVASTDERDSSLIDRSPSEFNQPPSQRSAVAKWGYDIRIEVRQMVFDGLATSNLVERQRLRREQAELRIASVANEVVTAVRQSYDAVLVRRAQLAAETQRVADLSQLADYAARKQAVGEIAELDLLNARSLLETARAEQADIERELTLADSSSAGCSSCRNRLARLPSTVNLASGRSRWSIPPPPPWPSSGARISSPPPSPSRPAGANSRR
jgi:outer membrane protein TolC